MRVSRRQILGHSILGSLASVLPGTVRGAEPARLPAKPKGVVFMVSDGMSAGVLTMAEAFSRQVRGDSCHWWRRLAAPGVCHGWMDTASGDSLVTDSAAASSAWSSGKRIPNGQLNLTAEGKKLESIGETLVARGARLGLVSTATITHATPAGFAASSADRNAEDGIAPQYLNRADIVLGGGSVFFDPAVREDKRDVFGEFRSAKYEVLRTRSELLASEGDRLLGTFATGHLPYTLDRDGDPVMQKNVPTLAEMTGIALERLLAGDKPFLLQVEGARIDHAAHLNDIAGLLHDQLAFDDAVGVVLGQLADRDDVLVVITSDHGNSNPGLNGTGVKYGQTNEHFKRIAGSTSSHERLLAQWAEKPGDAAALREMLSAGLGFEVGEKEAAAVHDLIAGKEVREWSHQQANPPGVLGQVAGNHFGTGWTGVSHTADPTIITATGPGALRFSGLVRNDQVRGILLDLLLEA